MHKRIAVALALALVALAPLAEARAKKPALEPGKYKEWGEDIDEIEIAKSFKTSDYDNIAVTRIDTSKTPLPDPKEKWYESAKTVLNSYTETLTESLRDEMKGKMKVDVADNDVADHEVSYSSRRTRGDARLDARYRPVQAAQLRPKGSLENWLTERYCLYTVVDRRVYRAEIHHLPWPLDVVSLYHPLHRDCF